MKDRRVMALIAAAMVIGLYHVTIAGRALFVFREDEPVSSWVTIVAGPLLTLPFGVLAIRWPRTGGLGLIIGGTLSVVSCFVLEGRINSNVVGLLLWIAMPMWVLGGGILLLVHGAADRSGDRHNL
jgi:hypothetical protein